MNIPFLSQASAAARARAEGSNIIDYDIHGLLGMRLINPSPSDAARVGSALGIPPKAFSGKAGIVIRFVDALSSGGPLRRLGRDDVGFTEHEFIILRGRGLARARAQFRFEDVGGVIEIVCESGLPSVPLLRPLINFAMLGRGIVPVHAAAFELEGRGILVTGWSHGSKTGSLLACMASGARFVGDEWVYLDPARDRMVGLPDHLEARSWYLRDLPQFRSRVALKERLRVAIAQLGSRLLAPLVPQAELRNSLVAKTVRVVHQALVDQQSIVLKPTCLFGAEACTLEARLDVAIVTISHDDSEVRVEPASMEKVARQMAVSFVFEHSNSLSCYQKYRFSFPERRNQMLDDVEEIYFSHALQALSAKCAVTMLHPYPVSTNLLRETVLDLIKNGRTTGVSDA